jgi:DNA-binding MarR family transcriptional regulator
MMGLAVPTQTGTVAWRLRMALMRIGRTLRVHSGTALTPTQLSSLATVEEFGPLRISSLALRESMGASAATRIVASLEEEGLLERKEDPEDKRASLIDLSDVGRAVLSQLWDERTLGMNERLERLSAKERAAVEAALPALEKLARDS